MCALSSIGLEDTFKIIQEARQQAERPGTIVTMMNTFFKRRKDGLGRGPRKDKEVS